MKPFYAIALTLVVFVSTTRAQLPYPGGLSGFVTTYQFSPARAASGYKRHSASIQHIVTAGLKSAINATSISHSSSSNTRENILLAAATNRNFYRSTNQLSRYFANAVQESFQGNTGVDAQTARLIMPAMDLVRQLSN